MGFEILVTWRGSTTRVFVSAANPTLGELGRTIESSLGAAFETLKLLVPGRKGQISPSQNSEQHVEDAGLPPGSKVLLLASRAEEVTQVRTARDLPGMRGFDEELTRAARRRRTATVVPPPTAEYSFESYEAWQRPGLQPPPSEALKLLYRLAGDPGIRGVMAAHRYRVGRLSEMPPEGKVGVSPVCILGVNINAGQEISLRLRTDDLKGFRKYERIRETLIHELAHMEFGEHDSNFKQLNSQLGRECAAINDRYAAARTLLDGADPLDNGVPRPSDLDAVPLYDDDDVMAVTARMSGKTLRQLAGSAGPAVGAPQSAAAPVGAGARGALATAAAAAAAVPGAAARMSGARALAASAAIMRSQARSASAAAAGAISDGSGTDLQGAGEGLAAAGALAEAAAAAAALGRVGPASAAGDGSDTGERVSGSGGSSSGAEGEEGDVAREFEHYDAATDAAEAAARELGSEDRLAEGRPNNSAAGVTAQAVGSFADLDGGRGPGADGVRSVGGKGDVAESGTGGHGGDNQDVRFVAVDASAAEPRIAEHPSASAAVGAAVAVAVSSPMEVDGGVTTTGTRVLSPHGQASDAARAPEGQHPSPAAPPPPLRLTLAPPFAAANDGSSSGDGSNGGGGDSDAVVQEKLRTAWAAAAKLAAAAGLPPSGPNSAAVTADDVLTALETLETVLGNAANLPGEDKYRRVRLGNAAFQRRLGRLPGGLELLRVAGFVDEGSGAEAVMRLRRNDPGLLWLVLSVVREARGQVAAQVSAGGAQVAWG